MAKLTASDTTKSQKQDAPYLIFSLMLSVYTIVALAAGTFFRLPGGTRTLLGYADTAVCVLFFMDFLLTLARTRNRWRYMATWGWLDLLSSVPTVDALRWGHAARVLRILRVLRGIKARKILSEFILYRRAKSAFLATVLVSLLLIVISASAIL